MYLLHLANLSNLVSEMGVQMRCTEKGQAAGMTSSRDEADALYFLHACGTWALGRP
jgi:hypothetical protein